MLILISRQAAAKIGQSGSWGHATLRVNQGDHLAAVVALSTRDEAMMPVPLEPPDHILAKADPYRSAIWYRVEAVLHLLWAQAQARAGIAVALDEFKARVPAGFKNPGPDPYLALTYAPRPDEQFPGAGVPKLAAWTVSRDGAVPHPVLVQEEKTGIGQLSDHWPVGQLQDTHIVVVGAGSIGGAVAHALAGYGVGRLTLIDPDHLSWHNLVRHTSSARQVGRLKVQILAEEIIVKHPDTAVVPQPWNVIPEAHRLRALLPDTDLVICAADGVAPRRVVSHVARRTRRTAVLACVLHHGAIGEILRLHPWKTHGCLLCRRRALQEAGSIDPEPSLDAGYGTGTRHQPMTAVGPDIHLVGQFAAKVAVATILERHGHPDQRLPGEHALLALRRQPDLAPPFDLARTGELRWLPATPPEANCPTCNGS